MKLHFSVWFFSLAVAGMKLPVMSLFPAKLILTVLVQSCALTDSARKDVLIILTVL